MKGESAMRSLALCLLCLLLLRAGSSVFADTVINNKDGKVVAVGRDVVEADGKILITDCKTGAISAFDAAKYHYAKGDDCRDDSKNKIPAP
jgi:hypothetical protein